MIVFSGSTTSPPERTAILPNSSTTRSTLCELQQLRLRCCVSTVLLQSEFLYSVGVFDSASFLTLCGCRSLLFHMLIFYPLSFSLSCISYNKFLAFRARLKLYFVLANCLIGGLNCTRSMAGIRAQRPFHRQCPH